MIRDLKYLLAYIIPLSGYASIYLGGWGTFLSVFIGFGLIPLIEELIKGSEANLTKQEEDNKLVNRLFDILLYLNVPLIYGLVVYYFLTISGGHPMTHELIGMTLSVGLILGTTGINVAHELGHRATSFERFLSKALLLPCLYIHFIIEHNYGHHKNVATDEDPASSRLNETVYAFWVRSTFYSYLSAWKIETERLKKLDISFFSLKNQMIIFQLIQVGYLLLIGYFFGIYAVGLALILAVLGFSMLELVNYIEHYGLRRQKKESGRYEPVQPYHSWNSNHELGRIMLYELTRHSDHHFKANRKYQVLRNFKESPQLPHGYPASLLIALVPPLWFKIMNKRVSEFNGQ